MHVHDDCSVPSVILQHLRICSLLEGILRVTNSLNNNNNNLHNVNISLTTGHQQLYNLVPTCSIMNGS